MGSINSRNGKRKRGKRKADGIYAERMGMGWKAGSWMLVRRNPLLLSVTLILICSVVNERRFWEMFPRPWDPTRGEYATMVIIGQADCAAVDRIKSPDLIFLDQDVLTIQSLSRIDLVLMIEAKICRNK